MEKKKNYLLESFMQTLKEEKKGKVLDIGCGDGDYAYQLTTLGFDVLAGDMDVTRFRYKDKVKFEKCNLTKQLPFDDETFDYVVLAETIEHVKNPYDVIAELRRVLKVGGKLILSTPNILNLKSRMRFLFEGCWEYFREIPLEHSRNPKESIWNLHLIPWRYHELEYMLYYSGFDVEAVFTSKYEGLGLFFLIPLIKLQLALKARRAKKKGGVDLSRINKIISSKDMFFGEHLIIKCIRRNSEV